jgi:hypothetical protein
LEGHSVVALGDAEKARWSDRVQAGIAEWRASHANGEALFRAYVDVLKKLRDG